MFNLKNYDSFVSIVNKEGYSFIIGSSSLTLFFSMISGKIALILFVITLLLVYFFRDPARFVPLNDNLILAPADGIIQDITIATPPDELGIVSQMRKISIFLSPLDVHVNRIPINGIIKKVHYHPGQFLNASLDKASILNERCSFELEFNNNEETKQIYCVQIAGFVARRIVNNLIANQEVKAGERFGIIKFSSRMDIYLPLDLPIAIAIGQSCIAGETILALAAQQSNVPLVTEVSRI
ncbi:MAG: phosphatidylserine decarboxylase [Rickettsiales bacterium]